MAEEADMAVVIQVMCYLSSPDAPLLSKRTGGALAM
jgi:hypothetical protein